MSQDGEDRSPLSAIFQDVTVLPLDETLESLRGLVSADLAGGGEESGDGWAKEAD